MLGAVTVGSEHVGRNEARSREIALVTEDAVELQRMSDRLVDLQHHLVGREQHVHSTRRAIRREQKLEPLFSDAGAGTVEADALEDLDAALLAHAALAVQRSLLRYAVGMRGDADRRIQVALQLQDVAAFAGDEPLRPLQHVHERFPVDDPRIARREL